MTFPQPSADLAVLGGSDFFRLNTLLQSPGDIYESAQGSHAFALGPDSDIANVDVFYWDPNAAGSMNVLRVSPDRSFVGSIYARAGERYQTPTPIPGRVLIAPADLYDPTWRPTGFNPAVDVISYIAPTLDVIQYFTEQPSLISQRSDKSYELESVGPLGVVGHFAWVALPAWGRKSASFKFRNCFVVGLKVTLYGVKLGISTSHLSISSTIQQELMAETLLASQGQASYVYKFSASGAFDYFAIKYEADGITGGTFGATTQIITSDDAL